MNPGMVSVLNRVRVNTTTASMASYALYMHHHLQNPRIGRSWYENQHSVPRHYHHDSSEGYGGCLASSSCLGFGDIARLGHCLHCVPKILLSVGQNPRAILGF